MKIAIINTFDAKDVKIWAGTPYYISSMLEKMFSKENVYCIKVPGIKRDLFSYLQGLYLNRIRKKKYLTWADTRLMKKNKYRYFKYSQNETDLIITFQFFLVPLLMKDERKVICWSDATFSNLLDNYSYVTNLSKYCIKGGHQIQKKALDLCEAVILSSDWAIDSATNYYKTDRRKITKIPFAPNFSTFPSREEIETIVKNKEKNIIKLLFIGIDWDRKGGDNAVEVVNKLNQKGYKTIIYIVGSKIPKLHENNPNLIAIGFVDKGTPNGENTLISLIKESSYLLLPSKAECFGIVFCEANSYGLPVITTDVDGIPSVVKNNINGATFSINLFVDQAIAYITNNLPASLNYINLCHSSFDYYNNEMSWKEIQKRFLNITEYIS